LKIKIVDKKLRNIKNLILLFTALSFFTTAQAQVLKDGDPVPQGAVIYSLPETSINILVSVSHVSFAAGPFASYSKKYLGIDASRNNSENYSIASIEISPSVEADPSASVAVNIGNSKTAGANFLAFCSQGLIVAPGYYSSGSVPFTFPSEISSSWSDNVQAVSNLQRDTAKLYKSVKNASGEIEKVAVPQTQIVEKTPEQKAAETAELIFKLRQKRIDILTGETDANYSGAALGDALKEINKLDKDYTSLFTGAQVVNVERASYDVVPKAKNAKQTYVAFRMSDTQGILPADNMSGRPIYLELSVLDQKIEAVDLNEAAAASKGKVAYRTPVIVMAKLIDGQKVLAQRRIPVYQFGKILYFPLDVAAGK
jgi:hypothetical protein